MGTVEMFGINFGTMTFDDSQVGFDETPTNCRSKTSLASGHSLDPVLHRWFADRYR
ncbi:hypothetical protein HAX54_033453, partial [Datura stramonium]|nr:hypothetical protein [Datura stramonium]